MVFLHRIVEGSADKSYGIHVARLAGVPRDVIDRASVILDTLETDHIDDTGRRDDIRDSSNRETCYGSSAGRT